MDAYIGEIRLMAIGFTPQGWFPCDGRSLSIQTYTALAAVMGNRFGGDGKTNFNLPDLRGRVVVGVGDDPSDAFDPTFGMGGGAPAVTLTDLEVPSHTHALSGATLGQNARVATAEGNYLSGMARVNSSTSIENTKPFATSASVPAVLMNPNTLAPFNGGSDPHENRQPYLALGYFINYDGIWPQRP